MNFDFPGNVRQLENICHWLTVMAPAQVVEAKDLPPELMASEVARSDIGGAGQHEQGAQGAVQARPSMALPAAAVHAAPPLGPGNASAPEVLGSSSGVAAAAPAGGDQRWLQDLQREARRLLEAGEAAVWDTLTKQFEGQLIHTALEITRGRRIEAAHKLGIGRNTITRKIQELGLDD